MLRQPQLHNQGSRASVGTSLPPESHRQNTHAHTILPLPWATEAWALGCGMPCLRWRRRMMTADSSQCDTLPTHPQKWAPPPHPPPALPSVHIFTSLSIPRPCSLRYSSSTSTCLDSSTWKPWCRLFVSLHMFIFSFPFSFIKYFAFIFVFVSDTHLFIFLAKTCIKLQINIKGHKLLKKHLYEWSTKTF